MSEEYIVLYTNTDKTSPWAHRVEIAFAEAGVQPLVCMISLQEKPEWFTSVVNPSTKQVPAIVYGGPHVPTDQPSSESAKLTQSVVLLEFLADLYPQADLLPKDPVQRAQARFFVGKVNTLLEPAWEDFPQRDGSLAPFLGVLDTIESLLPEGGFVAGSWSIADAAVAPFIGRAEVVLREDTGAWDSGEGLAAYEAVFKGHRSPRLARYWRECKERRSWKETFDETSYLQNMKKRFPRS
ncbi:unnamed protein product [Peniophora sp. CBMAI 1063]|nr:unnamed protein product [Peniophora sp. CBMAI 1063]